MEKAREIKEKSKPAEEEERKEIDSLIKELEFRVEKEMEFSDDLVERIGVLVYKVKVG